MAHSSITLSSLYSSGQCLLSVIGSIGVILLFAGIPQLIYAPNINPGSLMTFLLGALLITLMIAGNAFIGYKYRQLVRQRRTDPVPSSQRSSTVSVEDKPPSYDDLLNEDGLPPAYATIITEKPPKYDDLVTEVVNWQLIGQTSNVHANGSAPQTSGRRSTSYPSETPIIVPIQRHISETSGSFSEIKTLFLSKFKPGAVSMQPMGDTSNINAKRYNRSASFQHGTDGCCQVEGTTKSFKPHCCITGSNSDGNLSSLYFIHDQPLPKSTTAIKNKRKKGTTVIGSLLNNPNPSVHSQNSSTNQILTLPDSSNVVNSQPQTTQVSPSGENSSPTSLSSAIGQSSSPAQNTSLLSPNSSQPPNLQFHQGNPSGEDLEGAKNLKNGSSNKELRSCTITVEEPNTSQM